MRLEVLWHRLNLLVARRSLRDFQIWRKKKPAARQPAESEATNLPTNQSAKSPPALWERTPKMNSTSSHLSEATADCGMSRLGANLHVKGEISGSENLFIDGTFEGLVQLDERGLTVGTTAQVTAEIVASEVVVYGKVKGNVRAKHIEIKKDGSVIGDLTMSQIFIEDGAQFKGSIEIERSGEKEAERSVFPPAA